MGEQGDALRGHRMAETAWSDEIVEFHNPSFQYYNIPAIPI
jgi:hypothetical protein